jgi:4'-phosphopantetheinyl transferase
MQNMPDTSPSSDAPPFDPFGAPGFSGYPDCLMATFGGADQDETGLPPDERARLERLQSPARRTELAGSLILRRRLIARMTGAEAHKISISVSGEGAPLLIVPGGYSISIANKKMQTVVALAPAPAQIGVDLELLRPVAWRPMLAMLCDEGDRSAVDDYLSGQPDPYRAFLRMWTLKEATLKSTGLGFKAGPKSVRTPPETISGPGAGRLSAFGRAFDYWTADCEGAIVSLAQACV